MSRIADGGAFLFGDTGDANASFFSAANGAVGYQYENEEEAGICMKIFRELAKARDQQINWRSEAKRAEKFYAGDQWDSESESILRQQSKPALVYNRCAPLINVVRGYEVQNRQRMVLVPRDPLDSDTAAGVSDLATSAYEWALERCNGDHERSMTFRDALIRGVGWSQHVMDFQEDTQGKYCLRRIDGYQMWYDPSSREQNLSDANWVAREMRMSFEEIEKRFGKEKAERVRSQRGGSSGTDDTGLFPDELSTPTITHNLSPNYYNSGAQKNIPGIRDLFTQNDGTVRVIDFQWRELENVMVVVREGQEDTVFTESKFNELRKQAKLTNEPLPRAVKMNRYVYKRIFVCGNVKLTEEEIIPVDTFTYKAMTLFWDEEKRYYYGLMRAMFGPQEGANKYLSLAVHLLSVSPKATMLVEKGAVADPQEFARNAARPGGILWLEDGAINDQRIKVEPPPQVPQVTHELLQHSIRSLNDVTGIMPETLGSSGGGGADRAQTVQKRQTQGLTILAPVFDALSRFRRDETRCCIKLLAHFMDDSRWIRIGGPYDSQFIELLKKDLDREFDTVLDDMPTDPNEKRELWTTFEQHMPMLMRMEMFDADFWDLSPYPASMIARMKRKWKQKEQQQQQSSMQQEGGRKKDEDPQYIQSETELNKAQAELAKARAKTMLEGSSMDMAVKTQEIMHKDSKVKNPLGKSDGSRQKKIPSSPATEEPNKLDDPEYPGVRNGNGQ
tara:strand:+ start:3721 stop:5913 length:2193 start_codon:yes stop_codon:yes gene_type:complete